jgi:hypothetical protein
MNSKRKVLAASIALMVAATPALATNISCQIKSNGKVEATSVWRNALGPSADEICREMADQAMIPPRQPLKVVSQQAAPQPISTQNRPTPALVQRVNDGEYGNVGPSTVPVRASTAMPVADVRKEAIVVRYSDTGPSAETAKNSSITAQGKTIQPPSYSAGAPQVTNQNVPPLKSSTMLESQSVTWTIDGSEQRISRVFTRWANVAGQKLYWEAPTDVVIDQRFALTGTLESAISSVLALPAIGSSHAPLEACFYPNKVIRITRLGEQKDCK